MDEKARRRRDRLIDEAQGYRMLGMYDNALESLDRIPAADRDEFSVLFLRGDLLRSVERHAEALEVLHRAFEQQPADVDLLMALAWCYKRTDQLPRAITAMEQAYQIAPKEPVVLYNLSCYWSLAGDKMQCLSWLGRALRMSSELLSLIDSETDFDSLRHDPDFVKLVNLAKGTKT
ncbi:MAG: tetratricopeptide repeat protein [Planctomycetes bacterium]|nr:tetratricopeptide repeat protein [Planctomycetota bacterium]